jgi:3-deoxy-D-manno-octulosonic acid kinase
MPLRLARTNVDSTAGRDSGAGAILYDPSRIDQPSTADFEPASLERDGRLVAPTAGGRGSAWFVAARNESAAAGERWVLRHCRRGGLVAKFVEDAYLWPGEDGVRTFRELRLLAELVDLGLPAPAPVAARYVRTGILYRADLITVAIPGVRSLAARSLVSAADARTAAATPGTAATVRPLPLDAWRAVGTCIRRFHDAGVFHADLNAHNVLLDDADRVWLVDFDRGERRTPGPWREQNLARLERSLRKVAGERYRAEHRTALFEGYGAPIST